jgi:hypothetical protein
MRGHVLALTVAAALSAGSLCAHGAKAPVAGLWLGEARSRGGLGNWIEFRPDGTAQWSFGAIVEGTYRVSGTSLWIAGGDPPRETPAGRLQIEGDVAVRTLPAPPDAPSRETLTPREQAMFERMAKPIEMRRVGTSRPGTAPIVGTWQYTHPTGATAFETFTKDGEFVLRVQMQTADVTYTHTADGVRVKLPHGEESLVFHGDALVSTPQQPENADGARAEGQVFRRAPQ